MLSQLAVLAIQLDEYDEHFFNLMPTLFPYNKFTMSVCAFLFPHFRMMGRADSSRNRNSSNAPSSPTTSRCSWQGKTLCLQSWRCRQRKAFQRPRRSGRGVSLPGVSLFYLRLCPFSYNVPVYLKIFFSYTMFDSPLLRSSPLPLAKYQSNYSRTSPRNRQTPRKTPSRSRRRPWSGWWWQWGRGRNRLARADTTSYGRDGR